jgi:hypothetical protein
MNIESSLYSNLTRYFSVEIVNVQFFGKPEVSDISPANPFLKILKEESEKRYPLHIYQALRLL